MENLDFSGKSQNEILDELIDRTMWLSAQYKAAIEALPPAAVINGFQSGDAAQKFFLFSGSDHLPNMAVAAASMKTAPPVEIIPPEMMIQIQETQKIESGDVIDLPINLSEEG